MVLLCAAQVTASGDRKRRDEWLSEVGATISEFIELRQRTIPNRVHKTGDEG